MDFKDQLLDHSGRVAKLKNQIATEEAAKTALVLPFIQVLGYDIFDPSEVEPEHTCDVGIKKGEKIDYAIKQDGQPILLIECKHSSENLDKCGNQLFRYYGTSKAKFAVLTDGVRYRFFSDLDADNVMDNTPFLEVDITNLKDQQNSLEFVDLGEEMTRQKMLEMVYNATLQMSAAVTPMSIFNFMR